MLPADARPCVWMTAGIVAYKICDRDFECERCPLDAGLCVRQPRRSLRETDPRIRVESLAFPADRSYHRSHTWARPFEQRRVRSGIDAFAAYLLSRAASVILPADGAVIEHGTVGFWISEDTAPVPLVSPVSGRVSSSSAG